MHAIPTTPFDPRRHVIRVRESKEGREEFVTLESLVEAERPLEANYEASALDGLRAEIEALRQAPAPVQNVEGVVLKILETHAAPPELVRDMTAALTDLTKAAVVQRQDHNALAQRVEILATTLLKVADKLPGGMS